MFIGCVIISVAALVIFLKWFFRPLGRLTESPEVEAPDHKLELNDPGQQEVKEQSEGVGDDLTRIKGIGKKTAALLVSDGITTYAQLAQTPTETLVALLRNNGFRITNPTNWSRQALFAAQGDWDGLKTFMVDEANKD